MANKNSLEKKVQIFGLEKREYPELRDFLNRIGSSVTKDDVTILGPNYLPTNLKLFEGYLFKKNGENGGFYFIRPEIIDGENVSYVLTSWDGAQEKIAKDQKGPRIKVHGKGISTMGIIDRENYDDFERDYGKNPTQERVIELMMERCYSPTDERSKVGRQVILYSLDENPNGLLRREISGIRKMSF